MEQELKLRFSSLITVIKEAIELISGDVTDQGE